MAPKTHPIDKVRSAVDNEALRSSLLDVLENGPFSEFQEWADKLQDVADAVAEARDSIEEWTNAEGRDDKVDAKESALQVLDQLVTAWDDLPFDVEAVLS